MVKVIKNQESIQNLLGRFNPSDVIAIEELIVTSPLFGDGTNLSLKTIMQVTEKVKPDFSLPMYCVEWQFINIRSFRIYDNFTRMSYVSGFYIDNVSQFQQDGINWKVGSYEDDILEFECEKIQIENAYPYK